MVSMRSPPGASSTVAKSWRAYRTVSASGLSPVRSVSSSMTSSSIRVAQRPRVRAMRMRISAAAALV